MSPESTRMPTRSRFGMRPDHAQGVLQADRLGIHQIAQQRRRAHRGDEAVHHLVLGLGQGAVERLGGAHHLMADGADGLEQFGIEKLGGVVGGEPAAAADVAGQQQDDIGDLVGSGAQAELGVARRGQLHQPGLGRLDDRREIAAHRRLQIGNRPAHALEEQARHARQKRLAAGKAPDVDRADKCLRRAGDRGWLARFAAGKRGRRTARQTSGRPARCRRAAAADGTTGPASLRGRP